MNNSIKSNQTALLRAAIIGACASALLALPLPSLAADGAAAAAAPTSAPTAAIAVEDFFKASKFSAPVLSPDGKNVAVLTADQSDHLVLVILNVETLKPRIIARYGDSDIGNVNWVNNQRLVYSLVDRKGESGAGSGLFAIDIDGTNQRQLIERYFVTEHKSGSKTLSTSHQFFAAIASKEGADIWVTEYTSGGKERISGSLNLIRLNTLTGRSIVTQKPGDVVTWLVDENHQPRIATTVEKNVYTTLIKDDASGQWRKLFETNGDDESAMTPALIGPDGQFYVTALQGKDTRSLYRYDTVANKIDAEPLISLDGYDYNGRILFNRGSKKILGLVYDTDAPGTLWLDEKYKQIQKTVDDLLPGKVNHLIIRTESDADTMLVDSSSDVDPGSYFLYNHKSRELTLLGQNRPWIKPQQMAYQDFIKYKARDGLTIPGYLTLPKGQKKNLPLVVMVHGGPNVRGEHWGWNPSTQFLASRGYAVLQVEYRGSTGYGLNHERLGWKQWGLAMQDDVTDGTKWLIEQGIADPKRICIAGASYGGYASLWGLIKEPALYQCGISWVGVTDMRYRYDMAWSDSNDDVEKYYLPKKMGDLQKDAQQLKATSVVENAAKLTQPLILAYGGEDRRVPVEHGKRLKSAMNGANPNLEWIVYPEEGHGWRKLQNNVDFWTRVEKLLARTIGGGKVTDATK
jgi:dipeptidyl aminopeptidase/acylaminoacyl peptidase